MSILLSQTIKVSDLPRCGARTELESIVSNPKKAAVWVVLTPDGAYIGYPSQDNIKPELRESPTIMYHVESIQSQEQVARLGTLLERDVARKIFPGQQI